MTTVFVDDQLHDDSRREKLFNGEICLCAPTEAALALCDFARRLIMDAFDDTDPEFAQHKLPVEQYAKILAELKPRFIHHEQSKRLMRELLRQAGCNPENTYFDVPRLRTATSDRYLETGIAYAFHPHRDTWYSAPMCQINWWMPIYPLQTTNAMAFHPEYWSRAVRNSSHLYNYQAWNASSRFNAVQHIRTDTRVQPHALEALTPEPDLRLLPPVGGMLLFSGAQLHSTVPNTSGRTRFSIDFRTVHRTDAEQLRGARNMDSYCTGTSLLDYLRLSDLSRLPSDLVDRYMPGHPQQPVSARQTQMMQGDTTQVVMQMDG